MSYRAGSGLGARHPQGRDECATARGWLPAGTYTVGARHTRYDGAVIKGYAIPLSDKTCADGRTRRTALFIHSEMTRSGGQGRTESRRWDGPSDYASQGCIKLAPGDIKRLFTVLADGPAPGGSPSCDRPAPARGADGTDSSAAGAPGDAVGRSGVPVPVRVRVRRGGAHRWRSVRGVIRDCSDAPRRAAGATVCRSPVGQAAV